MLLPHHLIKHPSGTYHFRLVVPAHLQQLVGKKVIKQSLRTKNPKQAKLLAYGLASHHLSNFKRVTVPNLDDLLKSLQQGGRTYEIDLPGIKVKADGEDDHRRLLEALQALNAQSQGPNLPNPSPQPASSVKKSISLDEAVSKHLHFIQKDTNPKTLLAKKKALADFIKHCGSKTAFDSIHRTNISQFIEYLINQQNSKPTIVNKVSYIKLLFDWGQNSGYYPTDDNPALKQIRLTKKDRVARKKLGFEPFTDQEIESIKSSLPRDKPQIYWSVMLGIYTGARVNEVSQIELANIKQDGDLWVLTITDMGKDQRLKNQASIRTIPLHPKLIELGLVEQIEKLKSQNFDRLFPNLKYSANGYGNAITQAFSRVLKSADIKAVSGKKGFHSFRKTINHKMQTAGIAPDMRAQFLGHDLDDEHYQAYSRKYTAKELADVIFQAIE